MPYYITIAVCQFFHSYMKFSIHQTGHIGNRKHNQDRAAYAYSSDALLVVLADGMGGHLHGEVAADFVIDTFVRSFDRDARPHIAEPERFISAAMRRAHELIMEFARDNALSSYPGSTCVAALIQDGNINWGHAGDSRLYLLRNGAVLSRTSDHSMVQQWIKWGMITDEEARVHPQRNRITNCLGGSENMFYVETGKPVAMKSGDVLLLCSDGLWGPFTDQELASQFISLPVSDALDGLIKHAMERGKGHSDNITGIALRWGNNETSHSTEIPVSHILEIY